MATLKVSGSFKTTASRFLPYDQSGLQYWGMYGLKLERLQINHKNGNKVKLVGSPNIFPDFATFVQQAAYIDTDLPQTNDATFISVFRVPDKHQHRLISNYNSVTLDGSPATSRGVSLDVQMVTGIEDRLNIAMSCSVDQNGVDTVSQAAIGNYLIGTWCCAAGTYNSATKTRKVYHLTAGVSATQASTYPENIGSGKLRVGSPIVDGTGSADIAMSAIYNVAKTDAEITAIYNKLKTYYAKYGIAI